MSFAHGIWRIRIQAKFDFQSSRDLQDEYKNSMRPLQTWHNTSEWVDAYARKKRANELIFDQSIKSIFSKWFFQCFVINWLRSFWKIKKYEVKKTKIQFGVQNLEIYGKFPYLCTLFSNFRNYIQNWLRLLRHRTQVKSRDLIEQFT